MTEPTVHMVETLLHVSDSMAFASSDAEDDSIDLGGIPIVVQRVIDRDVDAVVNTGNLFRSLSPGEEPAEGVRRTVEQLDDADIPFVLLKGTRETTGESDVIDAAVRRSAVTKTGIVVYGKV